LLDTRPTAAVTRRRLDVELVRRGLARSREHAAQLVADRRVRVAGLAATKAATQVEAGAAIVVDEGPAATVYASRGGHKLAGALAHFAASGLVVQGRRCLDAGASTGGFTDVLLLAGASAVVAVDVGYGQLAWRLQQDPRVVVVDRTNVRELVPEAVGGLADVVVADLSFISLTLVLPALRRCASAEADLVVMVKPQFEVGRERLGARGVVRDAVLRADAVRQVADAARSLGLGVAGVVASALPGPSGNVEYFLWLRADAAPLDDTELQRAIDEGPA
jgi:23S rRNA (cytidine1920-2'-O)/16S rRNA (cytidine1409-2'-O)-methyltransferase